MRRSLFGVVLISAVLILFSVVNAFSLLPFKWNTEGYHPYDVLVKYSSDLVDADVPNHPYVHIYTGYEYAISDWNSAQSYIRFRKSSSANNTLGVFWDSDPYLFGQIWIWDSGGYITRFESEINTNSSAYSNTTIARSVAGHEFGHGLGLGHSTQPAIMNSNRNRHQIYSPQPDDISGVKAIYSPINFEGGESDD